jgi:hypothetical protein
MRRTNALALAVAMACGGAGMAAAPMPTLAIVSAGREQALQYGPTMLPRPFGAELIDTMAITGDFRIGRDRFFLVRGTGGANCPARYVVVAVKRGFPPVTTPVFGTCSAMASGRVVAGQLVVAMPAAIDGGPPIRFAYLGQQMQPLDAPPAAVSAATPDRACRTYEQASPRTQDVLVAEFQKSFPDQYRHDKLVKRAQIDPDQLRTLVTGLACFSTWPGAGAMVPEAATALFASKRYGAASFAALDTVARTPGTAPDLRAAVRTFSAQMRYQVGARTTL